MYPVGRYLEQLQTVLGQVAQDKVEDALQVMVAAYHNGKRLYFVGNGGSAATASHFVCDLAKNTMYSDSPCFKAIALTDNVPLLTAWSNDTAYENVFAAQLLGMLEREDVVVLISGSGQSPNILRAAEAARTRGAATIGFIGFQGGQLKDLVDVDIIVPSTCMEMIEDVHVALMHGICVTLCQMVRETAIARTLLSTASRSSALDSTY